MYISHIWWARSFNNEFVRGVSMMIYCLIYYIKIDYKILLHFVAVIFQIVYIIFIMEDKMRNFEYADNNFKKKILYFLIILKYL